MSGKAIPTARYVSPGYGGRCFSDVPAFVRSLLVDGVTSALAPDGFERLPQRYDQVVVLLVDAFGWSFFERFHLRYPFLDRFAREGSVTRLTSQFPSTTAAHVTTLYTGLPVAEHGVFEWFYYEPDVGAVIAPLLFAFAGDEDGETLRGAGVRPEKILPRPTFIQAMAAQGVTSYAYLSRSYARSAFSQAMTQGAEIVPYLTIPEALTNLGLLLARHHSPTAHFLYVGEVDTVCHPYGPDSPQLEAEVDALFSLLERWFRRQVEGRVGNTLILLLADHGQVGVSREKTIYLNRLPQYGQLERLLRTAHNGRPLIPAGSARDLFLYIQQPYVDEAQALLVGMLAGRADVLRVASLIEAGYFGPQLPSATFLSRVGDQVILPHEGESVWYYEKDRFEQKFRGHHGGLTPGEMEIPLLLLPTS